MNENKRFVILERKDIEYIFDTENTPAFWNDDVDIVELIGDSLSEAEIVDLLNEQDELIKRVGDSIDKYRYGNERLRDKIWGMCIGGYLYGIFKIFR